MSSSDWRLIAQEPAGALRIMAECPSLLRLLARALWKIERNGDRWRPQWTIDTRMGQNGGARLLAGAAVGICNPAHRSCPTCT